MSWKKQLLEGDLLTVRKNSGADVGTRKRLNFIEGSDITLTVADDAGNDEIDITTAVDNLAAAKITSGTFNALRVPILPIDRYGSALLKDGSRALTADWDIGDGRMIQTDKIRARDAAGLKLYEDGETGIFVQDGGNVGIGVLSPGGKLAVYGSHREDLILQLGDDERSQGIAFENTGGYYTWNIYREHIAQGTADLVIAGGHTSYIGSLTDIVEFKRWGGVHILAGSLDMHSHKIINVTDPTSAQDAVSKNYVDTNAVLLTGDQSIGGTKTFSDIPILPASDPISDNEAARKAYVDAAGGGGIGTHANEYHNPDMLCVDGSNLMAGTLNMGNHPIDDVLTVGFRDIHDIKFDTNGTNILRLVNKSGAVWCNFHAGWLNAWAGIVSYGTVSIEGHPLLDVPIPTGGSHGVNKNYVDDHVWAANDITSGTLAVALHQTLNNLHGTVDLVQIPTMDDGHIPSLETLTGGAFGSAQIPPIGAYKVASGTLNADRIPALPTSRITSGTFNVARIPDVGVSAINFVIDGGGSLIGAGVKGDLEVPFACHVDRWTLLADQHGSIAVDIWRDDYAAFPPTDADSMPGTTNTPAISGTIAAQGSALSGWGTRGITAGDILRYNVDSCVSIERVTLAFKVTKT